MNIFDVGDRIVYGREFSTDTDSVITREYPAIVAEKFSTRLLLYFPDSPEFLSFGDGYSFLHNDGGDKKESKYFYIFDSSCEPFTYIGNWKLENNDFWRV